MRSHKQIIVDAGGHSPVAEKLGEEPGTAKQWKRSDSIPGPYWWDFALAGLATLEELARHAARRRRRKPAPDAGAEASA